MWFCKELVVWHFATKWAAVKFVKPWMSSHVSTDPRDPSYFGSAMCSKCPSKDWRGKSCWLTPTGKRPEVVQTPGGVTASPTLLGPVLVRSQQNYQRLLLTVRYRAVKKDVSILLSLSFTIKLTQASVFEANHS